MSSPARRTTHWKIFRSFLPSVASPSRRTRRHSHPPPQSYASRHLPQAPAPPKKPARTGMTVEHPKYGTGTVVRREGEGDDAKITVSFQRYGLKKLVEKYAGLKKT